jgi:hypothetical protein
VAYLRTLTAVRERCGAVWSLAMEGKTKHFAVNMCKLKGASALCSAPCSLSM